MARLSSTQFNSLQSHRLADDELPARILKELQCSDEVELSPSKLIDELTQSEVLRNHDPHGEVAEQISIRTDRAVVASVALSLMPHAIVETGTSSGLASTIFIYPLIKKSNGYLFSIDLPHHTGWTEIKSTNISQSGALVPPSWRKRHINIVEDAKLALPRILPKLKPQIFIHDSLHTITHMLFEYSVARAFMPPKSLLVSDDILWNDAFITFCEMTSSTFYVSGSNPNFGFAIMDMAEDDLGVYGSRELIDYLDELEGMKTQVPINNANQVMPQVF